MRTGVKKARKGPGGILAPEVCTHKSGLELLRSMLRGELPHPPMSDTLDFDLSEVEEGRVVFVGEPRFEFYNPFGSVHGGWQAALLDTCMACAAWTALPAGTIHTTVEMKVNYLKPIFDATGPLLAEGRVIQKGQRIATTEGRLSDASGKLYAHGSATFILLPADILGSNKQCE